MRVERAGGEVAGHSPKHQIARRKRVSLLHRAHRDVLCGPRSNAGYVEQGVHHRRRRKYQLPGRNLLSEGADGLRSRSDDTYFLQRRVGKRGRPGKQPIDLMLGDDTFTPSGRQPAGHRCGGAHRYLLAKNGADRELERIPRTGQADARMARAAGFQQMILR